MRNGWRDALDAVPRVRRAEELTCRALSGFGYLCNLLLELKVKVHLTAEPEIIDVERVIGDATKPGGAVGSHEIRNQEVGVRSPAVQTYEDRFVNDQPGHYHHSAGQG